MDNERLSTIRARLESDAYARSGAVLVPDGYTARSGNMAVRDIEWLLGYLEGTMRVVEASVKLRQFNQDDYGGARIRGWVLFGEETKAWEKAVDEWLAEGGKG